MNRIVVKFSSVTYAMKAKAYIESNGGNAILRKGVKNTVNEGCAYSLVVNGNFDKILLGLDINKIKYTGYELLK